jgi:hypothetical protein
MADKPKLPMSSQTDMTLPLAAPAVKEKKVQPANSLAGHSSRVASEIGRKGGQAEMHK